MVFGFFLVRPIPLPPVEERGRRVVNTGDEEEGLLDGDSDGGGEGEGEGDGVGDANTL